MIDLESLPSSPGVYIYRNSQNEIIYVGKAVNLKKRVSQYFQRDDALGSKTSTLVSQIASVETKIVSSEIEALILESSLIKRHKPKYNSLLKDDKSYGYICITKDKLPRIFTARSTTLPLNAEIYGPFPNGSAVRSLLKTIRRIFPYLSISNHPPRPCLYCHLGLCPGPNPDPKVYRQNIGKIKKILNGNFKTLQRQLKHQMLLASKSDDFETALLIRRQLESIDYIVNGWHSLSEFYSTHELPEDRTSSALHELQTILDPSFPFLKSLKRIECYDISNMGARYFVGSMTVFLNNRLNHSEYKQFKIYTKDSQDDQFMIKEVIWRRLRHPEWGIPDLIVVDGGKPQVSAAAFILSDLNQTNSIALIGLAKKNETIVIKSAYAWKEINLPAHSNALRLLQQLRNEAHRFANRYRKKLMSGNISN